LEASEFLDYLLALPDYKGQAVHLERIPARAPSFGELESPLNEALQDCLRARGIQSLYSHQASAVNLARQGHNVMVSTPSASGKTLCYNVAVLQ
jgi:DEAD/DEAH box helicase domain-containing protein